MNDALAPRLRDPRRPLLALAAGSAAAVLAIALRVTVTGSPRLGFLVWNLFLAWIPVVAALALPLASRARPRFLRRAGTGAVLLVGLAFLPNAPYLVTDGVHLRGHHHGLWGLFDACVLGACGLLGVALGAFALRRAVGALGFSADSRRGRAIGALGIALSGYGIYLGRTLRLNSWDAFTDPRVLTLRPHLDRGFVAWSLLATLLFAIAFRHLPTAGEWLLRYASNRISRERDSGR